MVKAMRVSSQTPRRGDTETRGRGDVVTRRRGDTETRGRGDAGTRGRDSVAAIMRNSPVLITSILRVTVSPRHHVSASPRHRVTASPCHRVSFFRERHRRLWKGRSCTFRKFGIGNSGKSSLGLIGFLVNKLKYLAVECISFPAALWYCSRRSVKLP